MCVQGKKISLEQILNYDGMGQTFFFSHLYGPQPYNFDLFLYPVPQNAPHVSAGMNVVKIPEGQRPKAMDVSPWYGVYYRYIGNMATI